MNASDMLLILAGLAVYQSALMGVGTACMVILRRTFDWNPFSTRRPTPSRTAGPSRTSEGNTKEETE